MICSMIGIRPWRAPGPLGRARGEDGAAALVDAHTAWPWAMRATASGSCAPSTRAAMYSISDGSVGPARGAFSRLKCAAGVMAEDLEVRRRAVGAGGERQAVAIGELAAVALVADGDGVGTEQVAVDRCRAVEQPVLGSVDRVAAGAAADRRRCGGSRRG